MVVYVLLAITIAVLWMMLSVERIDSRIFLISSFSLMAAVLGFRGPQVGEDTSGYLEIAAISGNMRWDQVFSGFPLSTFAYDQWGFPRQVETAYLAFSKLVMGFADCPQAVLIVCAAVTCWGFARFIHSNSLDVGQSTWLFLCDSMFMFGFNGMRQLMAIALALQFYSCFKQNHFARGIMWIIFASFFHTSCLIFFGIALVFFLCRRAEGYRASLICAFAWPAALTLISTIVSRFFPRYALYFQVNYWSSSLGGFIIVLAILACTVLLLLMRRDKDCEQRFLLVNAVLYLSTEIMAQSLTTLSRVALPPRSFLTLYYPRVLECIEKKPRTLVFMMLNGSLLLLYLSAAMSSARLYIPFWI